MSSRYDTDVLSTNWRRPPRGRSREVPADLGVVVEEGTTQWCGAIVAVEKAGGIYVVHLEDRRGRTKAFPLGPGFLQDGSPITLVTPRPSPAPGAASTRTASGSRAAAAAPARVAQASRLFVEGRHDAELIEKIWGDDLRVEGVVVEMLQGLDDVADIIADFAPTPERRMGILADHLVHGTKEWALVEDVRRRTSPSAVRVLGHPYVDVWQSIRPQVVGFSSWPTIPRGQSWKHGILQELGWPCATQTDVAHGWRRLLSHVTTYGDLEPTLLAAVEELINFVTLGEFAI